MADTTPEERLLSVYSGFYFAELDRREKLSARFSILAVVYSLVIGAMAACLANLPQDIEDARVWWLYIALWGEGLMVLASVIYACRFLLFEKYTYVMPAEEIENYIEDVRRFNAVNEVLQPDSTFNVNQEVTSFLTDQFVRAATANFDKNNERFGAYTRTLWCLMGAVLFALMSGIPYFQIKYDEAKDLKSRIQKVEITNFPQR